MTSHRSNKDVRNLEFHQAQTSASKEVIITVLDLFSLMWQMFLSQQLHSNILVMTSSAMRVEKPSKAIWFVSYGMTMQKLTFLWQTRFDASWDDETESVNWGIHLLHSWFTCQCQIINLGFIRKRKGSPTWVLLLVKDAIRKPDISKGESSSWFMRLKIGFILHSHQALRSYPQIFFLTLRVRLGITTALKRRVLIWSTEWTNPWIWRWNQLE